MTRGRPNFALLHLLLTKGGADERMGAGGQSRPEDCQRI